MQLYTVTTNILTKAETEQLLWKPVVIIEAMLNYEYTKSSGFLQFLLKQRLCFRSTFSDLRPAEKRQKVVV